MFIHILSIQRALTFFEAALAYAAAKAALTNYNKGLSREVGPIEMSLLTSLSRRRYTRLVVSS